MKISVSNIGKPTPIKIEKIGNAILMFATGLTPIIATLPIPSDIAIWINAGLSILGLGVKIFTMMFSDITLEDNGQI